jgi:hypothetical protein
LIGAGIFYAHQAYLSPKPVKVGYPGAAQEAEREERLPDRQMAVEAVGPMTGETGGLFMQETAAGASEEVADATGEGTEAAAEQGTLYAPGFGEHQAGAGFHIVTDRAGGASRHRRDSQIQGR